MKLIIFLFIISALAFVKAELWRCASSSTTETAADIARTTSSCNEAGFHTTRSKIFGWTWTYCDIVGRDKKSKFYNWCTGAGTYKAYVICNGLDRRVTKDKDGSFIYETLTGYVKQE